MNILLFSEWKKIFIVCWKRSNKRQMEKTNKNLSELNILQIRVEQKAKNFPRECTKKISKIIEIFLSLLCRLCLMHSIQKYLIKIKIYISKLFHFRDHCSQHAQVKFEHWPYKLYAIYTNHFELRSTPRQLRTRLRYQAEIIHK